MIFKRKKKAERTNENKRNHVEHGRRRRGRRRTRGETNVLASSMAGGCHLPRRETGREQAEKQRSMEEAEELLFLHEGGRERVSE